MSEEDEDVINNMIQATSNTYAPDGGSYRKFSPPSVVGMTVVYSMVFLSSEQTVALQQARIKSSLISSIVSAVDKYGITKAIDVINVKFALNFTKVHVAFLYAIGVYSAISFHG